MQAARELGADRVELYTEPYATAALEGRADASLRTYAEAARAARDHGLGVNAGHDLNLANLSPFLQAVGGVDEVSIGHALIADAIELGLPEAVRRYLARSEQPARRAADDRIRRTPLYVLRLSRYSGRGCGRKAPIACGDRRWHGRCNFGWPKGDRSQCPTHYRMTRISMALTFAAGLAGCNDLAPSPHKVAPPAAQSTPPSEVPPPPAALPTPLPAVDDRRPAQAAADRGEGR